MFLNCHTWFSFKHGVMKPEVLLEEAAKAGVHLALTDIHCSAGIGPRAGREALRRAAGGGYRIPAGTTAPLYRYRQEQRRIPTLERIAESALAG